MTISLPPFPGKSWNKPLTNIGGTKDDRPPSFTTSNRRGIFVLAVFLLECRHLNSAQQDKNSHRPIDFLPEL